MFIPSSEENYTNIITSLQHETKCSIISISEKVSCIFDDESTKELQNWEKEKWSLSVNAGLRHRPSVNTYGADLAYSADLTVIIKNDDAVMAQ